MTQSNSHSSSDAMASSAADSRHISQTVVFAFNLDPSSIAVMGSRVRKEGERPSGSLSLLRNYFWLAILQWFCALLGNGSPFELHVGASELSTTDGEHKYDFVGHVS